MSSHRAEGFGKLSWLVFIHRFSEFHQICPLNKVYSFCDNKAIVSGTKLQNEYESSYKALCPNFDVLLAISITQTTVFGRWKHLQNTLHVKAHQEEKKPYDELSIEEKLNVKADELASEVLRQLINQETVCEKWHLPHCKAYLRVDESILSSSETNTLRWRYSEYNLQNYYSNKFKIPLRQLHQINWAALRLARNKLTPGQQTFSIKHAIGWMATGTRMQMIGKNLVTSCPYCKAEEDTDHILLCPSMQEYMENKIIEFQTYMQEINTDPSIQVALLAGFQNWLFPQKDPIQVPSHLQYIMDDQETIGWKLAARGFFSRTWANQQDTYAELNNISTIGDVWCSKICSWWILTSYNNWIERNNKLFSPTDGSTTRQMEETNAQVRQLYSRETELSVQDRIIFSMSLEKRLAQPQQSLQIWLNNMKPIVDLCIKSFNTRLLQGQRDIRTYFPDTTTQEFLPIIMDQQEHHSTNTDTTNTTPTISTNTISAQEVQYYSPVENCIYQSDSTLLARR
jgi:glutaredoxin